MRFLICGCNGMAGHTISLYLKERGHYVFGFDRQKSHLIDSVAGDACDKEFVKKLFCFHYFIFSVAKIQTASAIS